MELVQFFPRPFEFFFSVKVLMQNERGLGGKGLPCGDTASDDESSNRWSGKVETKLSCGDFCIQIQIFAMWPLNDQKQ